MPPLLDIREVASRSGLEESHLTVQGRIVGLV
jgi:hypothetical protein